MERNIILIADAGATKTDWALTRGGHVVATAATQGISPFHQDRATILGILRNELMPQLSERPQSVYFYGAGCTADKCPSMVEVLRAVFAEASVEVASDLLGAARALCGHSAGIACILGTGANSCWYDGSAVVQNTPPLGYILGDEGSGAVMGLRFVADVLKGLMPEEIRDAFFQETGTTYPEIIERVYRQPLANRYLASLRPVIQNHREHPAVHAFLVEHFARFIRRNVEQYGHREAAMHFVGGIAYTFRFELEAAALQFERYVGKTERSPMRGLVAYHSEA